MLYKAHLNCLGDKFLTASILTASEDRWFKSALFHEAIEKNVNLFKASRFLSSFSCKTEVRGIKIYSINNLSNI